MKKRIAGGPDVVFPNGAVFIRPTTVEERKRYLSMYANQSHQEFHTLLDVDATTMVSIVCGDHTYATAAARGWKMIPFLMH